MDPWSNGGLLMEHPASAHGGAEARQAVPILESLRRWNRGRYPRVSGMGCKYRMKGGTMGWHLPPGALLARPGGGPRQLAAWVGHGSTLGPLQLFRKLPSRW